MKWVEVVEVSSDQYFMQGLTGKTGLTQKEAIFQVIKSVLGDRYREGEDVRPIIQKENHYGRRVFASRDLDLIVEMIVGGIRDGVIPSERYGRPGTDKFELDAYARRIALYWLKRDRRLNGLGSGTSASSTSVVVRKYRKLRDENKELRAYLAGLKSNPPKEIARILQSAAFAEHLRVFLICLGVSLDELPPDIKEDLGLFEGTANCEKDEAA